MLNIYRLALALVYHLGKVREASEDDMIKFAARGGCSAKEANWALKMCRRLGLISVEADRRIRATPTLLEELKNIKALRKDWPPR